MIDIIFNQDITEKVMSHMEKIYDRYGSKTENKEQIVHEMYTDFRTLIMDDMARVIAQKDNILLISKKTKLVKESQKILELFRNLYISVISAKFNLSIGEIYTSIDFNTFIGDIRDDFMDLRLQYLYMNNMCIGILMRELNITDLADSEVFAFSVLLSDSIGGNT